MEFDGHQYRNWSEFFGLELRALVAASGRGPDDVAPEVALNAVRAIAQALIGGMTLETAAKSLWAVRTENFDQLPSLPDGSRVDVKTLEGLLSPIADPVPTDREKWRIYRVLLWHLSAHGNYPSVDDLVEKSEASEGVVRVVLGELWDSGITAPMKVGPTVENSAALVR